MKPVVPCCYEGECWARDATPGDPWFGPCWGQSEAIDEDYPDDPDLATWIHGCEGHRERFGPYVPEPRSAKAESDK